MKIFPSDFTIGAFAPAGTTSPEVINGGVEALCRWGAKVRVMPNISRASSAHRFLSACDRDRAEDFSSAWNDPEISMLWAVRGGYGSCRMVNTVDWQKLQPRQMAVAGFSDVTALHWAMIRLGRGIPMALPMFSFLADADEYTVEHLKRVFQDEVPEYKLPALRKGDICAEPLPGNMTVAASLCGTPYFPDCRGRIVILEEIGETAAYRIDRMLNQLRLAGCFDHAAGVVFGYFTDCGNNDELMTVLEDFTSKVNIPVYYGMKYGHQLPFTSIRCDRPIKICAASDKGR